MISKNGVFGRNIRSPPGVSKSEKKAKMAMPRQFYVRVVIVVASVAMLSASAFGRPGSVPNIDKLTKDSSLIAVVDVTNIRVLSMIEFSDHTYGQQVTATLKTDEVLKGAPNIRLLTVTYAQNLDPMMGGPWTPRLQLGDHLVVFLNCAVVCELTNSEHAGVPVEAGTVAVPAPTEDTPLNRVLQRLAVGLFRRIRSTAPDTPGLGFSKFEELELPKSLYADSLLHAALQELRPGEHAEISGELLATLVRRGDHSILSEVQKALASHLGTYPADMNMVYALQGIDWQLTLPIAAEALRSPSASIRSAAARAIPNLGRKTHSPPNDLTASATRILLPAVNDSDREVAFAAMWSLASLNHRHDQGPQTTSPGPNWDDCLSFWKLFPVPETASPNS